MKNSVKKLVTAVSTSVALLAAGNAAAEIKIGIAGPMTGPVASRRARCSTARPR